MKRGQIKRGKRPKGKNPNPPSRKRLAPRWTAEDWAGHDLAFRRRAGGRCECCGKPFGRGLLDKIERHHRIRRRDGGDRFANVILLRAECHQWWTEHPAEARERGIILSFETRNPCAAPLLHHGTTWVVLDDEGGFTRLPGEPDAKE